MLKRRKNAIIILAAIIAFYFFSFYLNDWLSATMQRHQLIQLPVMILIGAVMASRFPKLAIEDLSWSITTFIFVMSSLTFWMIPRSVDYTVIYAKFNRLMHLNMLLVGVSLVAIFRAILSEVRIYFMGMISAMLMVSGVTLKVFKIQLCSSFTIEMQHETGTYMMLFSAGMFLLTVITFFRSPRDRKTL
ncbi:MAG: hypothetical protein M9916_06535 [Crocinitomicaceae bacterium]|nr:hypothetical protein [Crocinitomicaceae bacterium]